MHGNNDGYATGSKDGTVILWDNNFKPITKLDMIHTPVGYEGDLRMISFPIFPFCVVQISDFHLDCQLAFNRQCCKQKSHLFPYL